MAAQLRALKEYAKANGYSVAREYVDEAESGRIAGRPQFRKMIDEGNRAKALFQAISYPVGPRVEMERTSADPTWLS